MRGERISQFISLSRSHMHRMLHMESFVCKTRNFKGNSTATHNFFDVLPCYGTSHFFPWFSNSSTLRTISLSPARFSNVGRLVGHNGAVCALATNQEQVMTGSRDRLIKLYEMGAVKTQPEASPSHNNSSPSHVS